MLSPIVASALLHALALLGIAWWGTVARAPLMPPRLISVEIMTAEAPVPTIPKPIAARLTAMKHALIPNLKPKEDAATPAPASAHARASGPAPEPARPPDAPAPTTSASDAPGAAPAAGAETVSNGDPNVGHGGGAGPPAGTALAATGPTASSLAADGAGGLTSFARPKGGYQRKPSYPESARRVGAEGTSFLRFQIREDGTVGSITVERSAGHDDLDRAAIAAVQRWRFDPARRGPQAVAVWVTLPVRFELNKP